MNRVFTVSLTRGLSKLSLLCHADATCRTVQRVSWRAPPGSPSGDFFCAPGTGALLEVQVLP